MSAVQVPRALAEKLGADGAQGLSAMLERAQAEWTEDVLTLAAERFERSLVREVSTLRVDVARDLSAVRQDVTTVRVDLMKWSFLFWIGQVAATAGLMAFMFRSVP
jgi:NAD(P)-dependent dehydrogenase (short-subunit alcohol dehydrogenase family)